MRRFTRALSVLGGRRVLLALGALYLAFGVGFQFVPVVADVGGGTAAVLALLGGGPGLVLLYCGYQLPDSEVRPEFYATIAAWVVGAIGVILGVLGLIELGAGLRDPVQNFLILSGLASVAGVAAGRYDARAKTRARDLELRNRELERTKAELEDTVSRLQTANERLEQFTYAASHDMQEPLRMVSSYLRLIEQRYADDLDDDGREFVDFAVGGADRMRAMVRSLLAYSQVSTGGEPLEPTDAGEVFEGVREDLADRIDETNATVTVDSLPAVTADRAQLAIVFENLLSNALTFSGDDAPEIHVRADRGDDGWRFSVSDEGIGIDPEFHDRIFTVFENLHAEDPGRETGSGGVGLALCERIVERHGGDIWVESGPDEGATFYFTLPDAEESLSEAPAEVTRDSPAASAASDG